MRCKNCVENIELNPASSKKRYVHVSSHKRKCSSFEAMDHSGVPNAVAEPN